MLTFPQLKSPTRTAAWFAAVMGSLAVALAVPPASRAAEADQPASTGKTHTGHQRDLTPQSRETLLKLVRPHEDEWRHLKVQWLTDVTSARRRAAAEDKPIIICYTGGAGYNEPLGVC